MPGPPGAGRASIAAGAIAPDMIRRMIEFGFEPVGGAPEKLGEFIRAEAAMWAPVVKRAGIRVD